MGVKLGLIFKKRRRDMGLVERMQQERGEEMI
jgi:hypothetical protein